MATPTWVGIVARLRKRSYNALNRGIIEYVETWEGKHDDALWPTYVIGGSISPSIGSISPTGLIWYDIRCDAPNHGPVAQYVAMASNKFDDDKAEWIQDISLGTYSSVDIPTLVAGTYYFFPTTRYLALPVVRKTTYHILPPAAGTLGQIETPVPPFLLSTPVLPNGIITPNYSWIKMLDQVSPQNQIWVRTQGWAFQPDNP